MYMYMQTIRFQIFFVVTIYSKKKLLFFNCSSVVVTFRWEMVTLRSFLPKNFETLCKTVFVWFFYNFYSSCFHYQTCIWLPHRYVYSVDYGRVLEVIPAHDDAVSALCWQQGSSIFASASWDSTVKLWAGEGLNGGGQRIVADVLTELDHDSGVNLLYCISRITITIYVTIHIVKTRVLHHTTTHIGIYWLYTVLNFHLILFFYERKIFINHNRWTVCKTISQSKELHIVNCIQFMSLKQFSKCTGIKGNLAPANWF